MTTEQDQGAILKDFEGFIDAHSDGEIMINRWRRRLGASSYEVRLVCRRSHDLVGHGPTLGAAIVSLLETTKAAEAKARAETDACDALYEAERAP